MPSYDAFGNLTVTTQPTGTDIPQSTFANTLSPTSVALGSGAGTTPGAATLVGNDTVGIVGVTTGTTPPGGAAILTVTFAVPANTAPYVQITPASAAAITPLVYVTSTTTGFTINSGATGLTASVAYKWNYEVKQ